MTASANLSVGVTSFTVTPHNSTNFTKRARALYVGSPGNLSLVHPDGTSVIWYNVPGGFLLPVECIRVNATGTTASNIVGVV